MPTLTVIVPLRALNYKIRIGTTIIHFTLRRTVDKSRVLVFTKTFLLFQVKFTIKISFRLLKDGKTDVEEEGTLYGSRVCDFATQPAESSIAGLLFITVLFVYLNTLLDLLIHHHGILPFINVCPRKLNHYRRCYRYYVYVKISRS